MGTEASSSKDKGVAERNSAGQPEGGQRPRERPDDSSGAKEPTAELRPRVPPSDHFAIQLRETSAAAFLYGSMTGLFEQIDTAAFKAFRDQLLVDAGNPTDPIEIMMIEQIVLAHMNIGRLQFKSAIAEKVEVARIYGGMATQLMGEFRRTALALQAFRYAARQGVGPVVLKAASPSDRETPANAAPEMTTADTELISREPTADDDSTIPYPSKESESGGRRAAEYPEAERVIA